MNSKSLRQISSLAVSTMGSRVLGLVRDAAFFSYFGTGLVSSSFIIAFTIPNLFRRLLGEGALSSAFLPVFAEKRQSEDPANGFQLLNQTLTALLLYFGGILFVSSFILFTIWATLDLDENWKTSLPMVGMLLPYALLICLAAILTAALNTIGKFFLASLSPILLNLAMIGAMLLGSYWFQPNTIGLAYALCAGVLLGGILQFLLPGILLIKHKWRPNIDTQKSDSFDRVKTLFFAATGGAAILQINILITRLIAYQHSDEAVAQLYLASRLTELPLGVFAIAITTVLFPMLSKFAAGKDITQFSATCQNGVLMILTITLPAAIGLGILSEPIMSLLFEWGRFTSEQVTATAPILSIVACSIPAYALIALLTRIFHAKQDMQSPIKISAIAMGVNIVLCLILMKPFGASGLATASVVTSVIQLGFLVFSMQKQTWRPLKSEVFVPIGKIALASVVMGVMVWLLKTNYYPATSAGRIIDTLYISFWIAAGIISYAILAYFLGLKKYLLAHLH